MTRKIKGSLKIEPQSAAPTAEKGVIYYDSDDDKIKVCQDDSTFDEVISGAAIETTITDDDSKIPSSGAVVDYVQPISARQTTITDSDTNYPTSGAVVDYGEVITPVGTILPWHKSLTGTPSIPANFVECNGQTLSDAGSPYNGQIIPNLNGTRNETNYIPAGATNIENAFDFDTTTAATLAVPDDGEIRYIGKTFTARYIDNLKLHYTFNVSPRVVTIETYNGSIWSSIGDYSTSGAYVINVADTIQGYRIKVQNNNTSSNGTLTLYSLMETPKILRADYLSGNTDMSLSYAINQDIDTFSMVYIMRIK